MFPHVKMRFRIFAMFFSVQFLKIGVGCPALGLSGTCEAGLPKTEWPLFDPVNNRGF